MLKKLFGVITSPFLTITAYSGSELGVHTVSHFHPSLIYTGKAGASLTGDP
jgi:hypothetical protein